MVFLLKIFHESLTPRPDGGGIIIQWFNSLNHGQKLLLKAIYSGNDPRFLDPEKPKAPKSGPRFTV